MTTYISFDYIMLDECYLYILLSLVCICILFLLFFYFKHSNNVTPINTDSSNEFECNGEKCVIRQKPTNKVVNCDGEKCV
jgi:hypothetical protein